MLFLPPPALFQLPGSPFSLLKRQISPLFVSAALHGMLPASGPGRKFPPTSPSPANTRTSLSFFPILRLFRPSLFLILSFFYISMYRQPKQNSQTAAPRSSPGRKEIPCHSDIFLINKKMTDFPDFSERGKRLQGTPVSENVSGNPPLYKFFFPCRLADVWRIGKVRKAVPFPGSKGRCSIGLGKFSCGEKFSAKAGDFAARESGHEKKSLP